MKLKIKGDTNGVKEIKQSYFICVSFCSTQNWIIYNLINKP